MTDAKLYATQPAEVARIPVAASATRGENSRASVRWKNHRNARLASARGSRAAHSSEQMQLVPRPGHPVQQRRFFEPRRAVQARRDPIAGMRHFAADGGVARLVRSQESDPAQAAQIHHQQRNQQPVFGQVFSIVGLIPRAHWRRDCNRRAVKTADECDNKTRSKP